VRNLFVVTAVLMGGALVAFLGVRTALVPPAPLEATASSFELYDVTVVNPALGRLEHRNLKISDSRIESISEGNPGGEAM
jgi:hypothetical protein